MTNTTKIRMTASQFFALPESNQIRELIDGELIVNPPKDPHQVIGGNTYFYLRQIMPNGKARVSPVGVYLDEINILEPDVFWVSPTNNNCALHEDQYWHGAPDLIVEVLSPPTARQDRVVKFQLYEKYGVREYWIIEPLDLYVEVWNYEAGKFAFQGSYRPGAVFASRTLGAEIIVARLLME
ncbi:MAG: Uma2 family endonuclease [Chloroflexi bacterium]|nr:Uma2 family endonuclease [Chloroflexota bacterium]